MKQLSMYEQASLDHHLNSEPMNYPQTNCSLGNTVVLENKDQSTPSEGSDENRVTEIILSKEMANNLQLVLPMLAHLNQENRWLAWVDPPMQLLKQWQQDNGALSDDIMVLRSNEHNSAFGLAQKALKAGTCHAVIVWTDLLSKEQLNSLDDASQEGSSHGIVLRYR